MHTVWQFQHNVGTCFGQQGEGTDFCSAPPLRWDPRPTCDKIATTTQTSDRDLRCSQDTERTKGCVQGSQSLPSTPGSLGQECFFQAGSAMHLAPSQPEMCAAVTSDHMRHMSSPAPPAGTWPCTFLCRFC